MTHSIRSHTFSCGAWLVAARAGDLLRGRSSISRATIRVQWIGVELQIKADSRRRMVECAMVPLSHEGYR